MDYKPRAMKGQAFRADINDADSLKGCYDSDITKHMPFCDIAIVSGSVRLKAHKIKLAEKIAFFKKLFEYEDILVVQEKEVAVPAVPPGALLPILQFAYSGQVTITEDNVEELLVGSTFLQYDRLVDHCDIFLSQHASITNENCLQLFDYALTYSATSFAGMLEEYIAKHFMSITATESFQSLTIADLIKIVKISGLHVPNEESIWRVITEWINFDQQTRVVHIADLLKYVQVTELQPRFIRNDIMQDPSICQNQECLSLLGRVLQLHNKDKLLAMKICGENFYSISRIYSSTQANLGPDDSKHDRIFILDSMLKVTMLETTDNGWKPTRYSYKSAPFSGTASVSNVRISGKRINPAVVAEDGKIFVIGGNSENGTILRDTNIFDYFQREWMNYDAMPKQTRARKFACIGVMRGVIYVCGGYSDTSNTTLSTVDRYYLCASQWDDKTPAMRQPRLGSASAVMPVKHDMEDDQDGNVQELWITGGWNNEMGRLNCVEAFNPDSGEWVLRTAMQNCRSHHAATCYGHQLYVSGGYDDERNPTATVECYDSTSETWIYLPSLSTPRYNHSMVAHNSGKLLVIGGYDLRDKRIDYVETLDLSDHQSARWHFATKLNGIGNFVAATAKQSTAEFVNE